MEIPQEILEKLRKHDARKVFIQLAEGLKLYIDEIKQQLEKEGFTPVFCMEPTYGACDVRDDEAVRLGCDAILHIGHADFGVKPKIPVIYWEYFLDVDEKLLEEIVNKNIDKLAEFDTIGLVTSVQYVRSLDKLKKLLEERGKKVLISQTLNYPGQILGCNVSAAKMIKDKVDCFIVLTAGKFYSVGMLVDIDKPVFALELEKKTIESLDELRMKYLKVIHWNLNKFKEAKGIGLLVTLKKGQRFYDHEKVKKELEEMGKEVVILAFDEIDQGKLEGIDVDFLVNTACPRLFDGYERFRKPILNWLHIKTLLNK
ncbi:MAG: diphthamide biosynthesis enzyme Dph2 [Candidatus Aenigmarchaeota archaeon]|nr:diphthamide biosynthesis enzyme Dph2 [Candidatus Aenigmarchaeota archaeon]